MRTLQIVKRRELIEPPEPIRCAMDDGELNKLADSIRQYGVILPLAVTKVDGGYEIIDGHRRYTAAGMIGLEELPVQVFENAEEAKFGIMLDANVCREDITAVEEGLQFLQVADKRGWGIEQICRHFGKSESYINDRVRLIERYPDVVPYVADRRITFGQARQIMRCTDPARRLYLCEQAATHGASVRSLIYMVDQWKTEVMVAAGVPAPHTPEHAAVVVPVVNPECVYCHRDDDQGNMTTMAVHTYHVRDVKAITERLHRVLSASASGS